MAEFFVTGANSSGARVFDVISDSSQLLLQSVLLGVLNASNPHSISVDPVTGDVFVPLAGSTLTVPNLLCPLGCIAVFAQVPAPPTYLLMLAGLGLVYVVARRRKRT